MDDQAEPAAAQMIVRLDADLHEAVRRWAIAEERSMAAQVRTVLRSAVPTEFFE